MLTNAFSITGAFSLRLLLACGKPRAESQPRLAPPVHFPVSRTLAPCPAGALLVVGSSTLKSISSEKRLMSSQHFESGVPPEKAGAMPRLSTSAITPIARTTRKSFSISPGRVPRSAAISSTRFRSSTLETQIYTAIAHFAAHAPPDADDPPCWHLGCLAGVVRSLETRRRRLDTNSLKRFCQG